MAVPVLSTCHFCCHTVTTATTVIDSTVTSPLSTTPLSVLSLCHHRRSPRPLWQVETYAVGGWKGWVVCRSIFTCICEREFCFLLVSKIPMTKRHDRVVVFAQRYRGIWGHHEPQRDWILLGVQWKVLVRSQKSLHTQFGLHSENLEHACACVRLCMVRVCVCMLVCTQNN